MNKALKSPRILIIRLSSIGDCIMASAVPTVLRRSFPEAHITWIVRSKSHAVVEGHPDVDEVLHWREGQDSLWSMIREIRRRKFDIVLELQGVRRSLALMAFSGARRRLVSPHFGKFARLLATETVEHPPGQIYPAFRYLYWAKQMGADIGDIEADVRKLHLMVPVQPGDRAAAQEFLTAAGVPAGRELLALNPGCSATNRTWPPERFAEAAREVLESRPNCHAVLLGGPQDVETAKYIAAMLPPDRVTNAAGQLKLRSTAALIGECEVMLTNDTGPMHMSVAMETCVVGVFGPIHGARRLPLEQGHVAVEHNQGCRQPHRPQCGKGRVCACLMSVTAPEVAAEILNKLGGGSLERP